MTWTRNGKAMPQMHDHVEDCTYVFHGNFNPEDDFDLISYSDTFTFTVEVGGGPGPGTAVLHIYGSFYSAECTNPSTCK